MHRPLVSKAEVRKEIERLKERELAHAGPDVLRLGTPGERAPEPRI